MDKGSGSDPIALTAEWVAAAMSGAIVAGDRRRAFTGVSIDTRTLNRGDLFVAIRGDRFDGADFAQAAIDAGAAGVVMPRGRSSPYVGRGFSPAESGAAKAAPYVPDSVVIEVDDTIAALH